VLLASALADLDPLHREVILLRDIRERSAPEATAQLGSRSTRSRAGFTVRASSCATMSDSAPRSFDRSAGAGDRDPEARTNGGGPDVDVRELRDGERPSTSSAE
jgi:poly(3-hydroxybutyrate) depolymerase